MNSTTKPHWPTPRRSSVKRTITLVGVALTLLLGVLSVPALAWDDCPKAMVNDPYPGACGRYVDTNNDGICDHSQPDPSAGSSEPSAASAGAETTSTESPAIDPAAVPAPDGNSAGADQFASSEPAATNQSAASNQPAFLTHYLVSPIAVGFFLIYGTSFVLYKTRRMRVTTHRKIWNVLLLATFLVTGIFGIILAIDIDYDLPFTVPKSLLFWHVETGIVMTLISLFHLGWHLNYYRNILREVARARKGRPYNVPTCQATRNARITGRQSEARTKG